MTRVAVVLSGCGVFDGSEIHEAVLTLLYLDQAGVEVRCFAPDKPQLHVVNHFTKEVVPGETRNVLVESARIARGEIRPLPELKMEAFDAVIFPGGFGAAKNLCTFAVDEANCDIDPDIARVIRDAVQKGKVVGTICISPVLAARALRDDPTRHPRLTIGTDAATAGALRAMGAENVAASVNEIVVDEQNRLVSTPAYMLGPRISNVAAGIEKLVNKVLEMAAQPA
ncbi:MAG TPA: isoprenoid biosynthesis glyoxalase ElbB [bacterium]|nr:isoprenoid biosynthesis glyoxalase ElbB [Candidatus Omnitrophota bacterium]HOL95206.1 isoprenoid biosynthesis glyoxalase ElbB [bacterium]